jgi:hypothetical protein
VALKYDLPSVGVPPQEAGLVLTRSYEPYDPEGTSGPAASRVKSGDLVVVRFGIVTPRDADFLVLADPLPGGLEPVDLSFETTGRGLARRFQDDRSYEDRPAGRRRLPVSHEEVRDREARFFADHVPAGVYEHRYLARAVTRGRFAAPQARLELMYHPEVTGLTEGGWFEVAGPP